MKKISQGAEAIIYLNKEIVIKDRIEKKYRLPEIDRKITKSRTKKEAKLLEKARDFIPVPKIIKQQDNKLFIEYIFLCRDFIFRVEKNNFSKENFMNIKFIVFIYYKKIFTISFLERDNINNFTTIKKFFI